jgi:hypothetical protein
MEIPFCPRRDANASKARWCSGFISIVVRISRFYLHLHAAPARHRQSQRADLAAPAGVSCLRIRLLRHIGRPRTFSKILVVDRRLLRLEITS